MLGLLTACASSTAGAPTAAPTIAPAPQSALSASATSPTTTSVAGITLPAGFRAELYASGLHGPTALAFGPDGRLYITQLNGGENDTVGQVVAVSAAGAAPELVLDKLLKPTGLAWRGRDLYLAAGRSVLHASPGSDGRLGAPVPLVSDLPFNSRSEGQIDLLPDGRLLFEASGDVNNDQSGRLLTLDASGQQQTLAVGLKNAYAHAVDPRDGTIFTTEIGDDLMNGQAPPEEINLVRPSADYGWPRCYADRQPASDRGGTPAVCANTALPLVTFPPHSTPTGLLFYSGADFPADYRNALYVALWNGSPPQVLRVTLETGAQGMTGTATPFIQGMKRPIALISDPRGGMLVLDHDAGAIYRITAN